MLSTPSTGLMLGLGLRLILYKLSVSRPISLHLLNSLWGACQGILVNEVLSTAPSFALITSAGLITRLFLHLIIYREFELFVRQLLGAVLGFLLSAVINQVAQETGLYSPASKTKSRPSRSRQTWRDRLGIPHIALDAISEEDSDLSSVAKEMARTIQGSEIGPQISSLRAQANAAAGDKRRIQEERKWAISQGNWARAGQLGLQIRRYQALIESFANEARRRKSEASKFLFPSGTSNGPLSPTMTDTMSELNSIFPSRLTSVPETGSMTMTMDDSMSTLRSPSMFTASHVPPRPSSAPPGTESYPPTFPNTPRFAPSTVGFTE